MTKIGHTTDHQLRYEIEQELNWTADVHSDRIGIAVNHGAVTLSGEVDSYPEKMSAVNAALRVRSVTALADEIVVRHRFGPREDADIARDASLALRNTISVPADSVTATVHLHEVTLAGGVAWQYQRAAAAHAIAGIAGVVAVHNRIRLEPPVEMVPAAQARANVTAALVRNAELEAQHIEVTVNGTEIRLTGQVATWAERHQAEFAAWCTPGVTHVDDRITIAT